MPGHKLFLLPGFLALCFLLLGPCSAWAYVGPGPGLELLPHFFSLLAWAGLAGGAVLLWPISALLRWLRAPQKPLQD